MATRLILFLVVAISFKTSAQTVTTDPAVPSPSAPVTITFDVTGSDFASRNLNDVWLWAWLENGANDVNAPTNVNPATDAQNAAKVTRSGSDPNIYFITLTATEFFNRPASEISTVGVLLKGRDWSNGQTKDLFIEFTESFTITFSSPTSKSFFVNLYEVIDIEVNTNEPAEISLRIGNDVIASSPGMVTELAHSHTVTESSGSVEVIAEADNGTETKTASFTYVPRTATASEPRPVGIVDGINYDADPTKVTLSLWAPGKSSVYVLGDFNEWTIDPDFQMKQDGEHFWLEINGLTPNEEYAFQYLVDESLKIADPYADKILDPDDQYIPQSVYPSLKPFPSAAFSEQWYFNRLAVLQTGQEPYNWVVTDFEKPAREELVIYELLVRDFLGEGTYQNLIDTIGYLKRLGVNAVELMPIMEFNGNDSWGYNPTFMFAPDKAYGPKNKLKEFIDACHQNGIAVILDIAMNHQDIPNAYALLDFDFVNMRPEADNKWFNVSARHPFNVFFDMNHESEYTKKYLDTVNYYWLNEYKVDGYRFDLSKGFTQTNNPSNADAWSAYDASRIALLKRMADKIWEHTPDAYVILEHLSVNQEEKELAEYRAGEGKGMMLWGKMTEPFNELTMGWEGRTDIAGTYYKQRGWSVPHLVSYMESHDEERLQLKNILYGNSTAGYNVKDSLIGLSRVRAASTLFYSIPGPKMLWQFGELGYDYSINHCPDGSINDGCRVSAKPVRWDYQDESHRRWLFDHTRDLIRLRREYDLFTTGDATISTGNTLIKQVILKNQPYVANPAGTDEMNAVIVVNFELQKKTVDVEFPHTGLWYDYYGNGNSIEVTGATKSIEIVAGGAKLFTDVPLESTVVTSTAEVLNTSVSVYPNPVGDHLRVSADYPVLSVSVISTMGAYAPLKRLDENTWDMSSFGAGLYVADIVTTGVAYRVKVFKR